MIKLQVIGSTGTLGTVVKRLAEDLGYDVISNNVRLPIDRSASNPIKSQYVINCAGIVKQSSVSTEDFYAVNTEGPHSLADACDRVCARLVHVSTDCVFQGPGPHDEDSNPDAPGIYAKSKLYGEIHRSPHCTVRTSFIGFGRYGLLHDLFSASYPDHCVKASNKLQWSGNTVTNVAWFLLDVLLSSTATGILHMPGEFRTRLGLCQEIILAYRLDPLIIKPDDSFIADRRLISKYCYDLGLRPSPFRLPL